MSRRLTVAVVGGGLWGQALALAALRAGSQVTLVSRREPPLVEGLQHERELSTAARSRLIVLAVPSALILDVLRELGPRLDGGHFVLHGVRGLVGDELATISSLVRTRTPVRRVGALGGPVLVDELRAGTPSVMVVGSHFQEMLEASREAFHHDALRLYMTRDLIGLEWASALTGLLSIAEGFAVASKAGPGLIAAFTTRAVHEAARITVAAGGEYDTLLGLAGLGDLLAAVNQPGRPEVLLGGALAQGATLDEAIAQAGLRVEALGLLPRLVPWAEARKVRIPIVSAIADAVLRGIPREVLIHRLMTEPQAASDRSPQAK
ncbi:MAG: NAD(P)-binding domain-containing protein [Myxococcales bacterium]|nr:NAD(P)-binding domain-containing protein [Polyangiaceae bacterium]MDW8249944.1 NAD(P)-binding domain-containing protein [Myxococcales bacterium]